MKSKKNEATVFYRENVNGKEKNYSLCQKCAEKLEKKGEISFSTPSFFGNDDFGVFNSIFGSLFAPEFRSSQALSDTKRCPLCGASYSELAKEGRSDAPDAMTRLATELERTISRYPFKRDAYGKNTVKTPRQARC